MKTKNGVAVLILFIAMVFTSCQKDDNMEQELSIPTVDNVEIGLNNNGIGVVGRDFHFNADIIAGDQIYLVKVKIQQRAGETYTENWSHEVTWGQYKGAKNTNVHKHFNIPEDAIEGTYDFVIIVTDVNGMKLKDTRTLTIYKAENLPVDPDLSGFAVIERDENNKQIRRIYNKLLPNSTDLHLKKGQIISAFGNVSGIKGDGKIYFIMVNKKHQHRPETMDAIDFSKVIVTDVWQHKDMKETGGFTSTWDMTANDIRQTNIIIGADTDNNVPPGSITGDKAWETGNYYFGAIYHNTTYNIGLFDYIEVAVDMD